MEVLKFNESNLQTNDRVFKIYSKPLHQRIIDHYNNLGYKLYYYKDFQLIEITNIRHAIGKNDWETKWGNIVFFLDNEEYEKSIKAINNSKALYDKHLEAAKTVSEIPMSFIYHHILYKKTE